MCFLNTLSQGSWLTGMRKFRPVSGRILVLAAMMLGGCASVAPEYVQTNSNVRLLQTRSGNGLTTGEFKFVGEQGDRLNQLTIRGGTFTSPYQGSYAVYLREALRIELQAAGRWNPNTGVQISGQLLDNQLDASGTSVGTARVSARFVVQKYSKVLYNKVITVDRQWESSFIGGIAIPRAKEEYIATIQKVIGKLFADHDFLRAIE